MCWRWLGSPLRCSLRASDLLDRFLKPTPLDDDRFAIESSAVSFEPPQKRRRNSATDPDEFELIDSVRSLTSAAASVIAELRMAMTQTASDVPAAVGTKPIPFAAIPRLPRAEPYLVDRSLDFNDGIP